MPVRDLRAISSDERIEADFCIVGSGPAGATIALELARTRAKVLLVESGGLTRDTGTDALNEIENIGWPRVMDQWLVRNRMLGGTSNTWAGRCAAFDDIDYEPRDWVPHSGWPFKADELTPYLSRSASRLGLVANIGHTSRDFRNPARHRGPKPAIDERLLSPCLWQFSRDASNRNASVNFAEGLSSSRADNLDVILNATVTHVNTNQAGTSVESIDVRGLDGEARKISSRCIVLSAGGIENARLLLASNSLHSCGLGNQRDLVGRFLMDHLKGTIGSFDPRKAQALRSWFGQYFIKGPIGNHRTLRGLRLSPEYQRAEKLLNGAVFTEEYEFIAPDDPWIAMKRLLRGKPPALRDAVNVGSNLHLVSQGLFQYLVEKSSLPRKLEKLELRCIVEQRPDPASRVTLSTRADRFGVPLSRIDWKVNEQEQRTIKAMATLLRAEFERLQIEPLLLEGWIAENQGLPENFQDIAHSTGTTRMSADPASGVVDAHCQVHGIDGLFVAGSSVFPTSGHANPAQMIVALAIRLADTLKNRIVNSQAA
jgi:choline dehydrogenase-like flavoprotein